MSSDSLKEGALFCLCNPLLDISVNAENDLLEKYKLDANNSILAAVDHMPLYDELITNYNPQFIAGGSGQNAARIAQKILKKPNVVVYMGSVGKDKYSKILEEKAIEDGVNICYQYNDEVPTGTCAVIITKDGKNRSLCANLAAANHFTIDHIKKKENIKYIENAEVIYISGFFLTVSIESVLHIAEIALKENKIFTMNISAAFICHLYNEQLLKTMPYVDILFGNNDEATEFAKSMNWDTTDIRKIAILLAEYPKLNLNRKRIVVITQGEKPVLFVEDGKIREFEVQRLSAESVVDTNGAGDGFVGGFLSQLIQHKPYDVCIKCGILTATEVIQNSGCIVRDDFTFSE